MKRIVLSTLAAVVIGAAVFAAADAEGQGERRAGPGGPGFHGRGPGGPGGFARLVDLTDEQRKQVRAIVEEHRASQQGPPAAVALRQQLAAEILADAPDEQKIDALRQQLVDAQGAGLATQIALDRKIAAVLTPEQRATARERLAQAPRGRRSQRTG
jgi:Spy/CpxP family protein refolding chaperone